MNLLKNLRSLCTKRKIKLKSDEYCKFLTEKSKNKYCQIVEILYKSWYNVNINYGKIQFGDKMNNRIHIFSGHFGSGKTEVALNFAIKQRNKGRKVTIVDFDIVNPYFRTNDARAILEENGIKVVANRYASSNLDMPTVPLDIMSVFDDAESIAVFDVGGDDDGALALGQYRQHFNVLGYEMHLVANTKRPLTQYDNDLLEIAQRIEAASGLKFTDIYNNTNLSSETDENTLFSNYAEIERLSQDMGILIKRNCGVAEALEKIPDKLRETAFKMNIYIPKPWEV